MDQKKNCPEQQNIYFKNAIVRKDFTQNDKGSTNSFVEILIR